jgi:hypothetical protein
MQGVAAPLMMSSPRKDGERLVADQCARAEDGVAEPERLSLADVRHRGEPR